MQPIPNKPSDELPIIYNKFEALCTQCKFSFQRVTTNVHHRQRILYSEFNIIYCIVLYCIVSIHLYSVSCSAHQSEALHAACSPFMQTNIICLHKGRACKEQLC